MSRFASFSQATAPIVLGKQMVRFSAADVAYVQAHGYFPENRDGRGDYMHFQFVLANGAETCSFKDDLKGQQNPRYLDNIKCHFDGKNEGDGYALKRTFDDIRRAHPEYASFTAEQILSDMLNKEFEVWFYRYQGKYLQVAFCEDTYNRILDIDSDAGPATSKPEAGPTAVVEEEELPFEC